MSSRIADRPETYSFQGTLRAVVLENPYTAIPLPEELFQGPFDQRWRLTGELYGPVWIGATLARLYDSGVPFSML